MAETSGSACLTSTQCAEISIRVASSREERRAAFRLAYQSYLRAGLCNSCNECVRITPHQLLPTTDILIAELRSEVISTLSLVRDGELGLPLEAIYPEHVAARRAHGLKLAEVSCLADRRRDIVRFFALFCDLARLMTQIADRNGVDQLLIAVHPRHARMYRRAMGFKQVGDDRDYPAVNSNPAVLLSLDLHEVRTELPLVWQTFVGDPLPEAVTKSRPICEVDRHYFDKLAQAAADAEASHLAGPDDPAVTTAAASLICA